VFARFVFRSVQRTIRDEAYQSMLKRIITLNKPKAILALAAAFILFFLCYNINTDPVNADLGSSSLRNMSPAVPFALSDHGEIIGLENDPPFSAIMAPGFDGGLAALVVIAAAIDDPRAIAFAHPGSERE